MNLLSSDQMLEEILDRITRIEKRMEKAEYDTKVKQGALLLGVLIGTAVFIVCALVVAFG